MKLLIIDTFGLIFRAYYAYPTLTRGDGTPSGAIFGVLQMLLSTIDRIQPDYIVCSLESETPTFRHELSADYKSNRKKPEEDLKSQISEIINMIDFLGIKTLYKDGFEADDVIGSFATQNQENFDEIEIITGDRDLLQLLSPKIKVIMPVKSFADLVEFNRERFEAKYEILLEDFVLYKSMIGDSSDNIKGIPGVGPKTAVKIINQFHSIDAILANLDQLPPRIAEAIQESRDMWEKFYRLCKIDTDIKLELTPEETNIKKLKVYKLRELVDRYEFTSIKTRVAKFIDKFEAKYGGFGLFDENPENSGPKKAEELRYFLADKVAFTEAISAESNGKFSLKNASDKIEKIKVISNQAFVLFSDKFLRIGNGKDFIELPKSDLYNFIITNNIKKFVGFDLKPFIKELLKSGIENITNYEFYDLQLAWHLIKQDLNLENINGLVNYLNADEFENLVIETEKKIKEEDIVELFEMEKNLEIVIACMENTGIKCDREQFHKLQVKYSTKIEEVRKKIFDFVGFEFNPASTKDLGHVLFEVLHLPVIRKTKTQYSTDDATLSKLEGQSEIIPMIKEFRMYSKALSTYVIGYEKYIEEDGKIHTTFNQAQVATGRLSSINPNLMNLPANEEIGTDIKKAFTAEQGKIFVSFDYSQIDLRVLAFLSKDPGLNLAFKNDEDIHTATMKLLLEKDTITKEERNFGKTINFGIVYGMEAYGLAQRLGIENKAAKEFIDKYFEKFSHVKVYFDAIRKQLDEKGYVNSFMNRKRYFRGWQSIRGFQRQMFFREAINMPVQSGTSELIKMAMINIFKYIEDNKIDANIILQIHDELIIEIDEKAANKKFEIDIKKIMESVYDIGVPLKVSAKRGRDLTFGLE
jgi:DNA polymerase-1